MAGRWLPLRARCSGPSWEALSEVSFPVMSNVVLGMSLLLDG
jgi:hypothetical protein